MGQVVVDPPSQLAPIPLRLKCVPECRNDDAGRGTHPAFGIASIPNMPGKIGLVRSAVVPALPRSLHLIAQGELKASRTLPSRTVPPSSSLYSAIRRAVVERGRLCEHFVQDDYGAIERHVA